MRRDYIVAVVLFALIVLIRLYYIWIPIDYSFHEGNDGIAAWKTLEGQIMYRDFVYAQTPLWVYSIAVVYLLFDIGLTQGRILVAIWSGALGLLIFNSGKKWINMKGALIGGLIFALSPLGVKYGAQMLNDFPAVSLALLGYYVLTMGIDDFNLDKSQFSNENAYRNVNTKFLLAGALLGLGAAIKLTVAPFLFAFIFIIIIEAHISGTELRNQFYGIIFMFLGFIITLGGISAFFLINARDEFLFQTLGQHLADAPLPWIYRFSRPIEQLWSVDKLLLLILLPSIPYALKKRYGRGLIIIMATSIAWMLLVVAFPHLNYYDMNLPMIAMLCGFFPLSTSVLSDLKSKFKWNRTNTSKILAWILIISYFIYLVFFAPIQVRSITEHDQAIKAVDWLKANTDPNDYVLCDNPNINIMAQRRAPFGEISIDLMNLGHLTSDMLIQSLYQYDILFVVVTKRQFGKDEAYNDFMEFIEVNYTLINAGYDIYIRDLPLNENIK